MRIVLARPTLVFVMGVAGSGKSTLARSILREVNAVYLDNNFIADAFFLDTRTDPEYLSLREKFYHALYRIVEENLSVGNSVLLDAPHVKQMMDPDWHRWLALVLKRTGAALAVVRCLAAEEELRRRLAERGEPRDRWKLEHWGAYREAEPPDVPIPYPHVDVWTDTGRDEATKTALEHVLRPAGPDDARPDR